MLGQHARDIAKDKTVEHILEIPCGNIAARNLDSLLTDIAYRDRDSARVEEMVAAFFAGFENHPMRGCPS